MTVEYLTSKRTLLGQNRGRPRYRLQCSVGPLWHRLNGGPVQDTDPTLMLLPDGSARPRNTPYEFVVEADGGRRVYPDKTEMSRYLRIPAPALIRNLKRTISGSEVRYEGQRYAVVVTAGVAGVHFRVMLNQAVPWDSLTLDIDDVGVGVGAALLRASGENIPRPMLMDSSPEPIIRPLEWRYANGQLTVGWDPTGLIYPVTFRNVTWQVGVGNNDGFARRAGAYFNTYVQCRCGQDGTGICDAWFNFDGSELGLGDTINSADLQVYEPTNSGLVIASNVYCEDAASPTYPTSTADYASRALTTAFTAWDFTINAVAWFTSPSIVAVIQELVDSYDVGNIQALWKDDGSAASNFSRSSSYENNTTLAAILTVTYTAGGAARRVMVVS